MLPPPSKKSRWDKMEKGPKDEAVMCKLEGRVFPVEIAYLDEPTADVVRTAVETIYDIHLKVSILIDLGEFRLMLLLLYCSNLQAIF